MKNTALNLVVEEQHPTALTEEELYFQTEEEIANEFATSAKTSIARRSVSAPLKQLISQYPELIKGSTLNYAKGREKKSLDTEAIFNLAQNCSEYDYTFCPDLDIFNAHYNFIYCGYCTNVLTPLPRKKVWNTLASLCDEDNGVVVVAARSSADKGIKGEPIFDGYRTKILTFQKGYQKNELKNEALKVFEHVIELGTKGAYRMVICSHNPITV